MGLRRLPRGRRQPEAATYSRSEAADGPVATVPDSGLAVLLRPDRAVVPFTGRSRERALLRKWCASGDPCSVRLIAGESGVGKSRLALQMAMEWDAAGGLSLTVAPGEERTALEAARAVSRGPVLLVVDEAETRADLAALLTGAMADPGPVRVLLVAGSLGEWWDRLAGQVGPHARPLLGAPPIWLDTPLAGTQSDAETAMAAISDFAWALSMPEPGIVDVERVGLRLPVLLLHAAALLSVVRSAAGGARPARLVLHPGVLSDLLGWEARYWRRTAVAEGLPDDAALIKQVVGAAALTGASTTDEIQAVLARLPQLSGEKPEHRAKWARWLSSLYPRGQDGQLGLLQPQMLAQAQVADLLADDPVLARALLRQLPPAQAEHAMTMLAHAAMHHREAGELMAAALEYDVAHLALPAALVATRGYPEVAGVLCNALGTAAAAPEELAQIAVELPDPSPLLAEANLVATLRARECLPHDPSPNAAAEWDGRAAALVAELKTTRAAPKHSAGPKERATMSRWERYRPQLAASLSNLAGRLHEIGRSDDAIAAELAAIAIFRELADLEPGHQPELASSKTNLAVWLAASGRQAEAIATTAEAVSTFRALIAAGARQYRPDLATALTNMGFWQSEQGDLEQALTAQQEAVTILSELAEADRARYRPDLGTALTNLGLWFSRAGRPDQAAPVEQEAAAVWRDLAATDPGEFRVHQAMSLNNLIITYRELGRTADAVGPSRELVVSNRLLAAVDPDTYRPELATALANLAALHDELGQHGAGLAPAKEAVSIWRGLADADPAGQLTSLARGLRTLASILSALGHEDEAAKASEEAATIANEADEAPLGGQDWPGSRSLGNSMLA